MSIILNGTTGITTPDVTSDGSLKIDASAPDDSLVVDASGNVGVGTSSPSASLDIQNDTSVNQLRLQTNKTNSTNKSSAIITGHYTNSEEGLLTVGGFSTSTEGVVYIGGGYGTANAATNVLFFTAANNTTTSGTERIRIDSSGNFLVGTTSAGVDKVRINASHGPNVNLGLVCADDANGTYISFRNAAATQIGSITRSGASTVAYNTSSDYRLKEDWVAVADASTRVNALKPVNFAWKVDGSRVDGFLAHEVADVVPEAVTGTKDAVDAEGNPEYQGIDQSKLVPLLTAALQEALAKIEDLTARVVALEGQP